MTITYDKEELTNLQSPILSFLVTEDMNEDGFDDEENNENESDMDTSESDQPTENPDEATPEAKKEKDQNTDEKPKVPVKVLTKEDVESGQYSIFDVILPLPGYNIEYPPNMKEFYEEQMSKDGLKLELRHKIK